MAWCNKGIALGQKGKCDYAIQAFVTAIEIDPRYAKAWAGKGTALKSLGLVIEADAAFAKAKELGYTN
jgi:Flp pilus assembly protein TadD